jgi:hypothetical protein
LSEEIVALENQPRRLDSAAVRIRAERRLARLRDEMKEIERERAAIVADDRAKIKAALYTCLVALNGVGPVLA